LPDVYSIPSIIEPAVDATTTIVLIQNGLAIEHPVAEAFPRSIILSAVSMIGAELKKHNEVIHTDPGDLILGPFYNELLSRSAQDAAARLFGEIYSGGGCKCTVTDNIAYHRWRKLAWNASFGPVCALTGLDSADVHSPENGIVMESILLPVIKEIVAAAAADGHHLPTSIVQDTLNNIPMESRFKPSMLVDCLKGRPMEIEGTLGEPLRTGKRLNVEMPVLSMLYQLLKGRQWSFVHNNV
jgi:2-dehydropantoate 2-reductase